MTGVEWRCWASVPVRTRDETAPASAMPPAAAIPDELDATELTAAGDWGCRTEWCCLSRTGTHQYGERHSRAAKAEDSRCIVISFESLQGNPTGSRGITPVLAAVLFNRSAPKPY
jgi:hypothetical protein